MRHLKTEIVRIEANQSISSLLLQKATAVIQRGGLVAFPTETVYGLGADALNETAVRAIFTAKERPSYDPIIAHISAVTELPRLAKNIPEVAYQLADRFWPGPLTLILPKADHVPAVLTANGPTVAVRHPNHALALALITSAGTPIGAPSANRFGHTSPTTARHVWEDLNGRIDLILDGGPTKIGVESTVIDLTQDPPLLLRPGGVSFEALTAVLPTLSQNRAASAPITPQTVSQLSPGMLEKHYAPHTPLWLFVGTSKQIRQKIRACLSHEEASGIALMLAQEDIPFFTPHLGGIASAGSLSNLDEVAQNLFKTMRSLDKPKTRLIFARSYPEIGIGSAVQDRLRRSATKIIDCRT